MAARLLADVEDPEVKTGPDTGFGTDFEGFASDPVEEAPAAAPRSPAEAPPKPFQPVAAVRLAPDPAEEQAREEIPSAPPLPAAAPSPPGRGPLLDRLARFRDALIKHTSAQGVFILDREGKPVMEDPAFGKLHFLARSLAQAYRPVSGQAGNVHVKIGANSVLEVVPVETAFGCLVLGAIVARPLSATAVAEIAQALRQAATPREKGGI